MYFYFLGIFSVSSEPDLHVLFMLNLSGREIFKPPILIKSGGGIHNYLYQLRSSSQGSMPMEVEGSNILGKFQITWRTNLGEPGRLQTQQILGSVSGNVFLED